MIKIGRNDPCPCGSGKKYKKCCIEKTLTQVVAQREAKKFKDYLDSFWSYEEANEMSTEEIIKNLQLMGIKFEKEVFLREIEEYYSAQQLSEHWFETYKVKAIDRDEDFPWVAAWVLWERMAPKNVLCMEQMDYLIDKGFEALNENDSKSACDAWLSFWDAIKYRIKPELKTLEYLDNQYNGSFYIRNICQDLENEMYNAGLEDPIYFEKRIEYCKEFCSFFPDEDEHILHNMRRAIAESYVSLKNFDEAKKVLDKLVVDYPDNPWSYIQYGDMYLFGDDIIKDSMKARELYNKALMVSKNKDDKKAIEERLEDLSAGCFD